jgi:deaminated glutathione amidase
VEPTPYLAACVQLRSTDDIPDNLDRAESLVARAAAEGAKLVVTPENTPFLGPPAGKLASAEAVEGPVGRRFAMLARRLGIHLLVGSVGERLDDHRCFNTALLYGPGGLLATYRKRHLFDIDLPGGPRFQESAHIASGDAVVVAETPLGRIGLTICYDLRFPEMYAACVARGAEILTVPSAFTVPTGRAHWHVLLRARAIETQCFVLAPAQDGRHDAAGARESYGHSLIVGPWGDVLTEAPPGEGITLAEIDLARVRTIRAAMPVAAHRRA